MVRSLPAGGGSRDGRSDGVTGSVEISARYEALDWASRQLGRTHVDIADVQRAVGPALALAAEAAVAPRRTLLRGRPPGVGCGGWPATPPPARMTRSAPAPTPASGPTGGPRRGRQPSRAARLRTERSQPSSNAESDARAIVHRLRSGVQDPSRTRQPIVLIHRPSAWPDIVDDCASLHLNRCLCRHKTMQTAGPGLNHRSRRVTRICPVAYPCTAARRSDITQHS
jgi:hypothetical protein